MSKPHLITVVVDGGGGAVGVVVIQVFCPNLFLCDHHTTHSHIDPVNAARISPPSKLSHFNRE